MITIDTDKCTGCGLCARICHEHCIALVEDTPSINYEFCSTCTQCVAVCPRRALSWDHVPPVAYDKARLPAPEQLDELFKERWSIRFFKGKKIDRVLLEEIIGYGIYAPANNFDLRAIVVDDEEIIAELDRVHMQYTLRIYNLFYRLKIVSGLARVIGLSREYMQGKPKVEIVVERGHIFHCRRALWDFSCSSARIVKSEPYFVAQLARCHKIRGFGNPLRAKPRKFLKNLSATGGFPFPWKVHNTPYPT